jgi:hemolysin activation/secretion protein
MLRCAFLFAVLSALFPAVALAQEGAEARFDIWEYEVGGVRMLSDQAVEAAVYPHLGEGKTFADVEAARSALEKAFRDAGYQTVLVEIPEQSVAAGVVRLTVTEAPLERVRVTGSRYHSQARILAEAPALAEGDVPHFPAVQEDIARLNRMPGRRVTPVLKPGKAPGTTEIELSVEDSPPWGGSLGLTDDHSPKTEPLRLTGGLHYDNLFQRLHALNLQYQTSPENTDQVKALSVAYLVPLWRPGEFLSMFVARSKSGVAVLDTTNALGNGTVAGVRWISPLKGDEALSHSLTFGLDRKNFREQLVLTDSEPIETPIRYWPFSLSYAGARRDPGGEWAFSTGLVWAFRGMGSGEAEYADKRYTARSNFMIFKWDVQRRQELGGWGGLVAGLDGQIADQPVVSNEQYSAGGLESVRGYLQAEALGDRAVRGSLEWRSPSLANDWLPGVDDLRFYAFLEGARLRVLEPLPSEASVHILSSAGIGLRLRAGNRLALTVNAGRPFKSSGSEATPTTRAHDTRVQFNTTMDF